MKWLDNLHDKKKKKGTPEKATAAAHSETPLVPAPVATTNTPNLFSPISTHECKNYFRDIDKPQYDMDDLKWLLAVYPNNSNATHTALRSLLFDLRSFLDATTLRPSIKQMRNNPSNPNQIDFLSKLNNVADALKRADACANDNNTPKTTLELFNDAHQYMRKTIARRLLELKSENDVMYKVYENKTADNTLHRLMPPITLKTLYPQLSNSSQSIR